MRDWGREEHFVAVVAVVGRATVVKVVVRIVVTDERRFVSRGEPSRAICSSAWRLQTPEQGAYRRRPPTGPTGTVLKEQLHP